MLRAGATAITQVASALPPPPPSPGTTENSNSSSQQPMPSFSNMFGQLHRLALVMDLLCALEQSEKTRRSTDGATMIPEDCQTWTNIVMDLADLLERLLAILTQATPTEMVSFSQKHVLAHIADHALSRSLTYTRLMVEHGEVKEVQPLLTLLNTDVVWRASGVSLTATRCYCSCLVQLIRTLNLHSREFGGRAAVDEIITTLLFQRLAQRPPYAARAFELMYFAKHQSLAREERVRSNRSSGSDSSNGGGRGLGMLMQARLVQLAVEECLSMDDLGGTELVMVRATREAVVRHLRQLESSSSGQPPLSFYQLLLLAVVEGMPRVDLTLDAPLVERAKLTHLTSDASLLHPDLLRLMMMRCYTARSHAGELLSAESAMAVFRALHACILQRDQWPAIAERGGATLTHLAADPLLEFPSIAAILCDAMMHSEANNTSSQTSPEDVARSINVAAGDGLGSLAAVADTHNTAMVGFLVEVEASTKELFGVLDRFAEVKKTSKRPQTSSSSSLSPALTATINTSTALLLNVVEVAMLNEEAHLEYLTAPLLHVLTHLFACAMFAPPDSSNARAVRSFRSVEHRLLRRLVDGPRRLTTHAINDFFLRSVVALSRRTDVRASNKIILARLEAYLRCMTSSSAAYAVKEELMLEHWVDVCVPAITANHAEVALGVAGLEFFIAPFLARCTAAPLFVPTYVAIFVPTHNAKYGEPSLPLLRHFARTARGACQGIEGCDETSLRKQLDDPNSALRRFTQDARDVRSLATITPTSAVLLVVSAIFDRLCVLWNHTTARSQHTLQCFTAYFSALANLLQCNNTHVLHRVSASVEALIVEHLRGSKLQGSLLSYVGQVVDNTSGTSKKSIAEWYLDLSSKVRREAGGAKL